MVDSTDITGMLQTLVIGAVLYQVITSRKPAPQVEISTEDGTLRFHLTKIESTLRRLIAPQSIIHFAAHTGMLLPKSNVFLPNGLQFPIDVVFIDAASMVVEMIRLEVGSTAKARCKKGVSLFIVNRGEADGLKIGDRLHITQHAVAANCD